MKVFVYGTLQRNQGNNRRLDGATFVREAFVEGFKLYHSGFPVASEAPNCVAKGEIWDIGEPDTPSARMILNGLDALEGYRVENLAGSMYHRKTVNTMCDEQVDMYVGNPRTWRGFAGLRDCPHTEVDGVEVYEWSRY